MLLLHERVTHLTGKAWTAGLGGIAAGVGPAVRRAECTGSTFSTPK